MTLPAMRGLRRNLDLDRVTNSSDADKVANGPIKDALDLRALKTDLATFSSIRFSKENSNLVDGQTVFTIPGGYTPGTVTTFLNGFLIPNSSTNGTTITLTGSTIVEDNILDVVSFKAKGVLDVAPLAHTHTKDQVGLSRVDNTSDADKVLSTNPIGDKFLELAVATSITRSNISTNAIPVNSIRVCGENEAGDFGEGAIYTLGVQTGLRAVQDKNGRWFNLVLGNEIKAAHLNCRPVFLRQRCTISQNSNKLTVTNGSDWKVGENLIILGAGYSPTTFSKTFQINGPPARSGSIYFGADGYIFNSNSGDGGVSLLSTDTAEKCAEHIRAGVWQGWTVTGSGSSCIFTKNSAGGTVGVRFSDINGIALPITETLNQEGSGDLVVKITSISGNILTLDQVVINTVNNGLCYLEHGTAIRQCLDLFPSKNVQLQSGSYLFYRGLKFKKEGSGITGQGLFSTIVYALTYPEPLIEFELPVSNQGYYGAKIENIYLDMMESRRDGVVGRRIWDGSIFRNFKVDNVAFDRVGFAIRRHSTQSQSSSENDQSVVSQSLVVENVHIERSSNSNGLYPIPLSYFEYVQEGSLINFKSIIRGDFNTWQQSIACQWEACRNLVANAGTSFALSQKGLLVTSYTGICEGCSAIGATFETNGYSIHLAGGSYDTKSFGVTNPRIIGAGGAFQIDRLAGGIMDFVDRNAVINSGVTYLRYFSIPPGIVTNNAGNTNRAL